MDVIVIGGGPAGTMAAITAAERGLSVAVFEKNNMLGRKLRITGKGRCNITNACDFDALISAYTGGGKFMFSSLRAFSNYDIMDFFTSHGLKLVEERGKRVFPASQKASDVAELLKKMCRELNVEIKYGWTVTDIITDSEGRAGGVKCGESVFHSRAVIIATGGLSYPATGSTGDGYRFAEKLGHTVTPLSPSLVGLRSPHKWLGELQGLTLKNIGFKLKYQNKNIYEDMGELLFTEDGISGPVVLSGSCHALKYGYRDITAEIDLKPALSHEQLDLRLIRDFENYSRKQIKNALDDLLPKSMIPVVIKRWGISPEKQVNQITKEERTRLAELLKCFSLVISGCQGFEHAVVTSGGVKLSEINPKTMESKIVPGLYIAGELLDVDGYTGGFNLTEAFSTGRAAGWNVLRV